MSVADRALKYAAGLNRDQLLEKMAAEGIDHPCSLAQAMGLSGRGTKWEVADAIVKEVARQERSWEDKTRRLNT